MNTFLKKRFLPFVTLTIVFLVTAGCGGNSAGDLNDNGPTDPNNQGGSSSYTIGGNVSGLLGTLALQVNGGGDLTVSDNGTFVFADSLADGSAYDVSIQTSPDGEDCKISNGSGTIDGANVTNIEIICRSWRTAVDMSGNTTAGGGSAYEPEVAMNSAGDTIAAWYQSDDKMFISEKRNGSWVHPADETDAISPNPCDGLYVYARNVAVSENGDAVVAWICSDGANDQVFMSEYRNGSWTHPADASDNISPDGQNAEDPKVAMDSNGNTIIIWIQYDGVQNQLFKSEYRNGSWTHPSGLTDNISPDGQNAYDASVAMDDNGNALIVWDEKNSGDIYHIFKSEYRNGSWTHPASLDDGISPDGQDAYYPKPAMDNNGNAIIAWFQSDGVDNLMFKSEYRNGSWTHPANLDDNISPAGQNVYDEPEIAVSDNGEAVIVWVGELSSGRALYISEYRNGSWTNPADSTESIYSGQHPELPQIAMDDYGSTLLVWQDYQDGNLSHIYLSTYRNGTWKHPADAADYFAPPSDTTHVFYPQVAISSQGNTAAIVWEQSGDVSDEAFISEYK